MGVSHPNHREITLKVVYFGPALAGKTTSIEYLHRALRPDARGQLVSVTTGGDHTIFFDFFPLPSPRLRGNALRVQIYATPGEVRNESTRQALLSGVDALVFVADSQRTRTRDNQEALEQLKNSLGDLGLRLSHIPHIFCWNKRDLDDVRPPAELAAKLNLLGAPAFDTVATTGRGVFDALKAITGQVLGELLRPRRSTHAGSNGSDRNGHGSVHSTNRRVQTVSAAQQALAGLTDGVQAEGFGRKTTDVFRPSLPTSIRATRPLFTPERAVELPESTPLPGGDTQRSAWLRPLSPESGELPANLQRQIRLSQLLPEGALREQLRAVEEDLHAGQSAQAVRRVGTVFLHLGAAPRDAEDGLAFRALALRIPLPRYQRFREALRRAEAGIATDEDGLFSLFFLLDAMLAK